MNHIYIIWAHLCKSIVNFRALNQMHQLSILHICNGNMEDYICCRQHLVVVGVLLCIRATAAANGVVCLQMSTRVLACCIWWLVKHIYRAAFAIALPLFSLRFMTIFLVDVYTALILWGIWMVTVLFQGCIWGRYYLPVCLLNLII